MKIIILHNPAVSGCAPDEADSIEQADQTAMALAALGHQAHKAVFDINGLTQLAEQLAVYGPDLVFNLVEECGGNIHLNYMPMMFLDSLGLRYTGSPAQPAFVTTDKLLTKRLLKLAGLPTPPWLSADSADGSFPDPDWNYLHKPICADASLGLSEDSTELLSLDAARALLFNPENAGSGVQCSLFAEGYVEGREFNISLIENNTGAASLPPAEIVFDSFPAEKLCIVGYKAKWDYQSFEYLHTIRTFPDSAGDRPLLESLRQLALRAWTLLQLRGYARIDFRIDAAGNPWILEANCNPCLAANGGLAAAAQKAGLSYPQLIAQIIDAAFFK